MSKKGAESIRKEGHVKKKGVESIRQEGHVKKKVLRV